ncbi:hypothetical protein D3C72_1950940 [compost metagenome]
MHDVLVQRITLVVVVRRYRPVDRDLVEVRPTQAADLGIGVREQPALQQRVVGKVDTWHDMAWAERHLFDLGKEIVRVAVEHHLAQRRDGYQFLRDDLGRVQQVEVEFVFVCLRHNLHAQFPFGVVTGFDGFP